jgi:xanthine dehydrogenase accessory factor
MAWLAEVAEIAEQGTVVRVTVARADGSTPREVGAAMLVATHSVQGTIGGGALELAAITHARMLLARSGPAKDDADSPRASLSPPAWGHPQARPRHKEPEADGERGFGRCPIWVRDVRDFPLGPSLGQCCGGFVRLLFEVFTPRERDSLLGIADLSDALLLRPLAGGAPLEAAADRKAHRSTWPLPVTRAVREMLSGARPREPALVRCGKGEPAWFIEPVSRRRYPVYVYGAGHVGRALVRVLQDLPFAVTWIDTSADRFPGTIPAHAKAEIVRDPAAFAGATAGEAFHIVLTYSHALDLAICLSLLRRGDFRYLGLIGSGTKRARFIRRLSNLGVGEASLARLVCPIGVPGLAGKEPAVIALSVAVQLAAVSDQSRPLPFAGATAELH